MQVVEASYKNTKRKKAMKDDSAIPGIIDPAGKAEAPLTTDNSARKKILLLEDEVLLAMAESEMLKCHGYDVKIATSGEEAVSIIKADPTIDLVLIDINMGTGIDGAEAAKQMLTLRDIPVVFITSHSGQEMVKKVSGITRYGYVIKNSGDSVLLSSIEMAFEQFNAHKESCETNRKLREKGLKERKARKATLKSNQIK